MESANIRSIGWARGRQNTVLQSLQKLIPDGLLVVNEHSHIVDWNRRFLELWHLPEPLLQQGDHQQVLSAAQEQVADSQSFLDQIEYLYRHPEKSESGTEIPLRDGRWLERYSSGLIDRGGARWGRIWFFRDITERKRAHGALRESEARFFQLAEHIRPATLYMMSTDRQRLLYVSPANEQILGISNQTLFQGWPHKLLAMVHPEDRTALQARLASSPPCREEEFEYRILRHGREIRWLRTSEFPIRTEAGDIQTIAGILEDVTERKASEAKVWQLQSELAHMARLHMVSALAAGLAHELNQPLSAIATHAHACLQRVHTGQGQSRAQYQGIENILQQGLRAGDIVRRLRGFVSKSEPKFESVSVHRLIQEAVAFLEMEVRQHEARLHLDLDESLPPVHVDTVQIQQVVVNLVQNALDALRSKGNKAATRDIRITATVLDARHVEIAITDNGPGLPPGGYERLFQPFVTTKTRGTGLGLWISQFIVESHHGRLYASNRDHSGAVFCFTLPIAGSLKQVGDRPH